MKTADIPRDEAQRLAALRAQNDSMSLDPIKTAELRGRISEIKGLLQIDKPDTKPE